MGKLRISPQARAELDAIWLYIARESGSADIATRVTDSITQHFWPIEPLSKHRQAP